MHITGLHPVDRQKEPPWKATSTVDATIGSPERGGGKGARPADAGAQIDDELESAARFRTFRHVGPTDFLLA